MSDTHFLESLAHDFSICPGWAREELQAPPEASLHYQLRHGDGKAQVESRRLRHVSEPLPHRGGMAPEDLNSALQRLQKSENRPEKRALSPSVRAHHAKELSLLNRQIHISEYRNSPVPRTDSG